MESDGKLRNAYSNDSKAGQNITLAGQKQRKSKLQREIKVVELEIVPAISDNTIRLIANYVTKHTGNLDLYWFFYVYL